MKANKALMTLASVVQWAYSKRSLRRLLLKIKKISQVVLPASMHAKLVFFSKRLLFTGNFAPLSREKGWADFHSIPKRIENYSPLVSVIVPNYNHGKFLRERLATIYAQDYKNFEVILLDDASDDDSKNILKEFSSKYKSKTKLLLNKKNSGLPFKQWLKGISHARGELIWIAESDDKCDTGFLSEMVPYFSNSAVMFAFCKSIFIDEENRPIWSTNEYLSNLEPGLWDRNFVASAKQLVEHVWTTRNIVPNVSSALFRKPYDLQCLYTKNWVNFRVCADWIFYLNIIRGGLVGYCAIPLNYYRIHKRNTSVSSHKKLGFYKEHATVCAYAKSHYHVSQKSMKSHWEALIDHLHVNEMTWAENDIDAHYRETMASVVRENCTYNIMICGFALTSGGGEIFPINLANQLKKMGFGVIYFNFARLPTESRVRNKLRADIPLFELNNLADFPALVTDLGVHVVHTHHTWVDVTVADLLRDDKRVALVVTSHGMYETLTKSERTRVQSALAQRVDQFVYIAQKNLLAFDSRFIEQKNFIRIPNAIEVVGTRKLRRSDLGIPETSFVAALVSRAIPEKGWQDAVEAVESARKTCGRDIRLLLVGEGPEYERLKRTEKSLNGVHLLGFRDDVQDIFSISDIGILPSVFSGESYPLVALECLAAGRPFAANDIGDIKSILDTPNGLAGWIIPRKSERTQVDLWADLFVQLSENSEMITSMDDRVRAAQQKHCLKRTAEAYADVYKKAISIRNTKNNTSFPQYESLT